MSTSLSFRLRLPGSVASYACLIRLVPLGWLGCGTDNPILRFRLTWKNWRPIPLLVLFLKTYLRLRNFAFCDQGKLNWPIYTINTTSLDEDNAVAHPFPRVVLLFVYWYPTAAETVASAQHITLRSLRGNMMLGQIVYRHSGISKQRAYQAKEMNTIQLLFKTFYWNTSMLKTCCKGEAYSSKSYTC